MTQASFSDFIRLNGIHPWIFCPWWTIPSAMSRMTAAKAMMVRTPVWIMLA